MAFDLGQNQRGVRPTMNVTPLVDVVLVLLIIFMVITPMMVKQLSVNVPTKDNKVVEPENSEDDEPQVVLRVVASGQIYINKTPIGETELEGKLRRVFAARSDQTLFFDADETVPFERAMNVLDRARGTGLSTIAVLTEAVN